MNPGFVVLIVLALGAVIIEYLTSENMTGGVFHEAMIVATFVFQILKMTFLGL